MITGKIVSLHISQSKIHAVEAQIGRGRMELLNSLTIPNANRFFNERGQLINLVSMVDTIVMSMVGSGMTAKKLFICLEGMFEADFTIDPVSRVEKKKGISLPFLKKDDAEQEKLTPEQRNSATVRSRHQWGQYETPDERGSAVSTVVGEKDMILSLVSAFNAHGYRVLSIEPPETVLVYGRNTVQYTYDSLNKIIIWADNEDTGSLYILTKDVPSVVKMVQFGAVDGADFLEQVRNLCLREAAAGKMRNPLIYLIGAAFGNVDRYISIAQDLEYDCLQVIDLYGLGKDTEQVPGGVQILISEDADPSMPEIAGDYGICISQLLRSYDDKPENLCDTKLPPLFSPRMSLLAARGIQIAAAVFLAVNVVLTGLTAFEAISVSSKVEDSGTLRSQLIKYEAERDSRRTQLEVLNAIDPKLASVFDFVYENVDASLNIASVDTVDMLPASTASGSNYNTESANNADTSGNAATDGQQTAVPSAKQSTEQQIVIRGYSTQSSGSIELYNAMTRFGLQNVILAGHQQVDLPSGEKIYVFEIRIGG